MHVSYEHSIFGFTLCTTIMAYFCLPFDVVTPVFDTILFVVSRVKGDH